MYACIGMYLVQYAADCQQGFHWFTQSLQTNAKEVPSKEPQIFPNPCVITVHNYLTISLNAMLQYV
jgi:hypothetical protein